ncbi:protein CUSTOS [Apis mellifera caucasica]|uniref:Protein CUSTOS n=1 Tax=Apis mellifera TaxID=7460 RepID=A0A7M7GIC4_APIME|nr:protein CUSTOS [Apis mellifera]KAG6800075.1 protein CUSTOS [Apis mellifera caucasica]KAG9432204.1 protein CUSTOS [Apis mellifera carnica]|eukprot:XP_003249082.2 protein CUSTOS [Apis mellifera]
MLEKNNDDSSSSEDEISTNAIKEATDHQLLKEHYFSNEKFKNTDVSKKPNECNSIEINTNPISLRKKLEHEDTFSNFGVTPTFQNYVAKKLDEMLEKSIKIKKKTTDNIINEKDNESNNYGIKLLNSSSEFLTLEEDLTKFQKKRKMETNIDEKANLLKCKEVAVDPEHILSKIDTKAWTNKRKEIEFNYKKLKNGTLVEKPNNRLGS